MKKILSISLALLMLVCLCMSMVSCQQDTAFSKYYSYLEGLENQTDVEKADDITIVTAKSVTDGDENKTISVTASVPATDAMISVTLFLTENASTYHFMFSVVAATTYTIYVRGEGSIDALSYTGNEMVVFDEFDDYTNTYQTDYYENQYRSTASSMLKTLVLTMKPMMAEAGVNVEDFYFISVEFPTTENDASTEEDLGGPLSAARWTYVGQMLVVGLGMVFLVLAILWIVLIIFEKAMGTKPQPEKKAEPKVEPVVTTQPPVTPPVAQTDDAAIVAAITAAIAATIQSDEQLSEEFAGGFRVVSFRKKNGRGPWNH